MNTATYKSLNTPNSYKEECIDNWVAYNERLHRQIHVVAGCLIAASCGATIILLAVSAAIYDLNLLYNWMWSTVIAGALIWSPPAICLTFVLVKYSLYGISRPIKDKHALQQPFEA